jgi:molybdate transport system regulatory protein
MGAHSDVTCNESSAWNGGRSMQSRASTRPTRKATVRQVIEAAPKVRFRMRILAGDRIAIGPGKIALLEAIRVTGSLTDAAKRLDMSYRRAWLLLDELNGSLRTPAVLSVKGGPQGGGSQVTSVGERLVDIYRRIEDTAASANARDIKRLLTMLAP